MSAAAQGGSLTWLGHGTVVLELDGTRLVTDPVLRNRLLHLRRAWPADAGLLGEVDAVLISHLHYDHLDFPSLAKVGRDVRVVVPKGGGDLVRKRGYADVREVEPGDELELGSLGVRATEAVHDGRRRRSGPPVQALGFVVEGTTSVYYAGDTDLFDGMSTLRPGLDVALVPIWGWGTSLGAGHLDPTRAAEAVARLAPRTVVPIHWGTYFPLTLVRGRAAFVQTPRLRFERDVAARAPGVELRVLGPNETLPLGPGTRATQ